ncbi:LlaJI family restriction endonuclease [Psychromonas hadalis]|uniref:LlaJI family restriction endonuclease n=1 Tax=Psychromonas hadalis TaxID=211669 RepID=UPI00040B6643|nr:LlaJI family restriction endonuclease [Psychromonas hadalis]
MTAFEYYCDGDLISDLPELLTKFMKQRGLIAPDHVRINYCGFVSLDSDISVFMPKNSGERGKNIEGAHYLLQTLDQYYNGKLSGVAEGNENELIGNVSLSLASSLIEDYFINGLYVRRKKRQTLNQGRADWRRTISRHTPFPSGGGLVYLDLETSSISYVSDCETAKIHAQIIREIHRIYGALLFGKNTFFDERLQQLTDPLGDDEARLSQLDRELTNSYSERDIQLIGMLKSFIERRSKVEGAELLVGTRKFHNVWEGMLDACLPNKLQLNKKLPVPYYLQDSYFHEVARKGQRTDTVIENDERTRWAIIDAKYYRASSPSDGPGWPDLVKQFFYKTAAEEACVEGVYGRDVTVTLHFIFPGAEQNLLKVKVGKRNQGKVSVDDMKSIDKYGEVICHYCDPMILINNYINDRKLDITNSGDIQGQIFPSDV